MLKDRLFWHIDYHIWKVIPFRLLFCLIWGASHPKVHQRCSNNFSFNDFFVEIILLSLNFCFFWCCRDHETCIYETLVRFDIKGLPFFGTKIHLTKEGFKEIESNYWFRKCFYKELIWHLRLIEKRTFFFLLSWTSFQLSFNILKNLEFWYKSADRFSNGCVDMG